MNLIDVPFFAIEFKEKQLILFDKHRKLYHEIDFNEIANISIKEKFRKNIFRVIVYFFKTIVLAHNINPLELVQTKLKIKLKKGNPITVYTSLKNDELNKIIRDIKLEVKIYRT